MTDQMELFAPTANFEPELISGRSDRYGWQIKVSQFPDGLWRAAPDFHGKDWGFSWPLGAEGPGHPSRAYAIEEAAGVIRFHVSKNNPSPAYRRPMAELETLSPSLPTAKEAT